MPKPRGKQTKRSRAYRRGPRRSTVDSSEAPSDLAKYAIDVVRKTDSFVRMFNTEDKMFDTTQSTAPDNAGIVIGLSAIRQGTSWNNRVGNSIRLVKWIYRMTMKIHPTPVTTTLRAIVFSDMNNNGVFPNVTDVLESANCWSAYNHSFLQRFAVIVDKLVPLSQQGDPYFALDLEEPTNFHIYYEGDSGTNAMYRNNNMFVLFISDQTSATAPPITAYSRLHYVDD